MSYWGMETQIDLFHCDSDLIRDKKTIQYFLTELVEEIEMRAFGKPIVVYFGEEERVAGFSALQLIETSLISGHFANADNSAYINVFSCKAFDPKKVKKFCKDYFKAAYAVAKTTYRGVKK